MNFCEVAERKAVEELDNFEAQTQVPTNKKKRGVGAPGSAASFAKSKKK